MLAIITVNDPGDFTDANPNITTLREAIDEANLFPDADEIYFASNVDGAPIVLTEGELSITKSVTIDAQGQDITIDASGNDPTPSVNNGDGTSVFSILLSGLVGSRDVTLAGLTITGGDVLAFGGGVDFNFSPDEQGNPNNGGSLTIRDSVIEGNHAEGSGGGLAISSTIVNSGSLQLNITSSTIRNNSANGEEHEHNGVTTIRSGGGIYADVDGNDVNSDGVVFNLTDSTVSGNEAIGGQGGGIWFCAKHGGTFNATNSTISGNRAVDSSNGQGGGLWISREDDSNDPLVIANLDHLTITNNSSPDGGGLFSDIQFDSTGANAIITTLTNTIVSGNEDGNGNDNNIAGQIDLVDSVFNLLGTGGNANLPAENPPLFNIHNNDPGLLPLGFYGGPTKTHKPFDNSLAIDNGDPTFTAPPSLDQRGFQRVFDIASVNHAGRGPIDIGAVEVQSLFHIVTNVTISGSSSQHDSYSFAEEMADPNWIAADQLKTVPVGGADTVSIQFSEHVTNINANSLLLKELSTGQVLQATGGYGYNQTTRTATWTFSTSFNGDQHYLSLSDAVTDVAGNQLDGEWVNPFSVTTTNSAVSEFPSGDGSAGGDFNFVFTILPGDASQDNLANGIDRNFFYLTNLGGSNHTFQQADYNGDGVTNEADDALWAANIGTDLRELVFADFSANGVVDLDDYFIWLDHNGTEGGFNEGDADHDGDIDMDDFAIMQNQFELELDWVA